MKLVVFKYQEEDVKIEFGFDTDAPNHKNQIGKYINLLKQALVEAGEYHKSLLGGSEE